MLGVKFKAQTMTLCFITMCNVGSNQTKQRSSCLDSALVDDRAMLSEKGAQIKMMSYSIR